MPSDSAQPGKTAGFRDRRSPRRSAHRTVFDARQKLTSMSGTRLSYDYDLLREYANSRLSTKLAMPLMLIILTLFASLWVPLPITGTWCAIVVATNTLVVYLCHAFSQSETARSSLHRWTVAFVLAELLYGIAWSTVSLFSLASHAQSLTVIVFAMLLVGIAANAFITRTLPKATLATTLPVTVTVVAYLVSAGDILSYTLAAVALGGEIFFVSLARQLHESELVGFKHRAEKDSLIYELQEAHAMSDEARRQAERANIAKSNFLATMSHELRTPLNAIIGFSEVLKSELLGPHEVPQYKEYAADIHSSGQLLLNLINELLDLSRIEAGKYELSEEAISLVDIAEDCRRMLEIKAKSKAIELVVNFEEDMPRIWGDERAIRQVVLNILSNAIKFTPQNGRVELCVRRNEDGGQYVSVRDTGPGIPPEEIETVLASFGQGSLAQKSAEQGAGLGLPIVQQIMDLHQGRFDIFSKVRFGTEAIATFPRARSMDALAAVTQPKHELKIYSDAG